MRKFRLFILKLGVNLVIFDYLSKNTDWLEINGLAFGYVVLCYTAYITSTTINQFVLSICINLLLIALYPVALVEAPQIIESQSLFEKKAFLILGLFITFYYMAQL